MAAGILILVTGTAVPRPKGTWARFSLNWQHSEFGLKPTYGSLDDVRRWLKEDFKVAPERIEVFEEQNRLGVNQFFFDVNMTDDAEV